MIPKKLLQLSKRGILAAVTISSLRESTRWSMTLLLLVGYLRSSHAQHGDDGSWDSVKKEGAIEVFTRNNSGSDLKEIRITLKVRSTVPRIVELLGNVPRYKEWVYKCSYSERLKTVHANEFYYYIVSDFPFPFSDRDLIVHSKQQIDPKTGAYTSHSVAGPSHLKGEQEGLVRIPLFESSWLITPISQDQVYIDYQAISSPGGDIPVWLVNLAITKGPSETMKRFVELIEASPSNLRE